MSNKVKRALSPKVMTRVQACALVFLDSTRRDMIASRVEENARAGIFTDFADERVLSALGALEPTELNYMAIKYVLGACKHISARGQARNYTQALDLLEAEQVGDRYNPLTKTDGADKLARDVNRIKYLNEGVHFTLDGVRYVCDYDLAHRVYGFNLDGDYTCIDTDKIGHFTIVDDNTSADVKPKPAKVLGTLYAQWEARKQFDNVTDVDNNNSDTIQFKDFVTKSKSRNKVLNTLYADWESRQAKYDPLQMMLNRDVSINLHVFFMDYANRLSKTAKKRLYQLAQSDIDASYIMANRAVRNDPDPDVRKLASATVNTLYPSFPHKDSISGIEYIGLVRQYVDPPIA